MRHAGVLIFLFILLKHTIGDFLFTRGNAVYYLKNKGCYLCEGMKMSSEQSVCVAHSVKRKTYYSCPIYFLSAVCEEHRG